MNKLKLQYTGKRFDILAICFFILCLAGNAQNDSWQQMKSLDIAARRFVTVGFSIGAKGYAGTGLIGDSSRKDFWEYDPDANTWLQKADFGGGIRNAAVGFSIGSKGYVGTGIDSETIEEKNDFWEYDPDKNTWTQKANFPGAARVGAAGFSIGDKGYVGLGRTDNFLVYFNDFWEYDPTKDAWTQIADFGGTERYATTTFTIGTKAYVGMGTERKVSEFYFLKDFWEYDQQTNTWTRKADFGGNSREQASAFVISSKGFVGTGFNGNDLKDFWEYDPANDTWTRKADFDGGQRYASIGFSINGYGYIGMGMSTIREKSDLWRYNPHIFTSKADTTTVPATRSKNVMIKY